MHRLLERQLKRLMIGGPPEGTAALLAAVDEAYQQFDQDRAQCERSMEISSRELEARNAELHQAQIQLKQANDDLEARVALRTAQLRSVNEQLVLDMERRREAEEALRESEERYALAMRGANDGLWDWNLKTGEVYYSPRWKAQLGCTEQEISALPQEWFKRVHADDLATLEGAVAAHREGVTPHFEVEHRMLHSDGRYRWMLSRGLATRDELGRAMRLAGSATDITVRKEAEEQLLREALHDNLTGLANRALFLDRLDRVIGRTKRDQDLKFAVLFLDMDRFKVINDSLGHASGDQLLVAFSQRLQGCLRPGDTVARLGGDEFTLLVEEITSPEDAHRVADRILETLKQPFDLDGNEVFVTASIGIAMGGAHTPRSQDLLRNSDLAMYRAKSLGKARHQLFDATMHDKAVKQLHTENDLRRAIERNEFELFYQPIVSIARRMITGFEALIRWRHPERGLVPPIDFIPVAEDTGLIIPIGLWVLREACRQTVVWHKQFADRPLLNISVNLSSRQFTQPDLVEQVMEVLRDTGLPPRNLVLEVTESVVMDDPESAARMLNQLRKHDIQLNIDDFGTGYSSLSYLQRFPVDTMKIDRSFINKMSQDPENAEIVRTIISLAHNLAMKVTAEGIETPEQLKLLESLECENAQGYLFSKPVPAAAAETLLNAPATTTEMFTSAVRQSA